MNRSIIFRNAWTSARNLATVNGGTARQYIADALRKAWKGIVVTVESLTVAPAAEQIQKLADALVFAGLADALATDDGPLRAALDAMTTAA